MRTRYFCHVTETRQSEQTIYFRCLSTRRLRTPSQCTVYRAVAITTHSMCHVTRVVMVLSWSAVKAWLLLWLQNSCFCNPSFQHHYNNPQQSTTLLQQSATTTQWLPSWLQKNQVSQFSPPTSPNSWTVEQKSELQSRENHYKGGGFIREPLQGWWVH